MLNIELGKVYFFTPMNIKGEIMPVVAAVLDVGEAKDFVNALISRGRRVTDLIPFGKVFVWYDQV